MASPGGVTDKGTILSGGGNFFCHDIPKVNRINTHIILQSNLAGVCACMCLIGQYSVLRDDMKLHHIKS